MGVFRVVGSDGFGVLVRPISFPRHPASHAIRLWWGLSPDGTDATPFLNPASASADLTMPLSLGPNSMAFSSPSSLPRSRSISAPGFAFSAFCISFDCVFDSIFPVVIEDVLVGIFALFCDACFGEVEDFRMRVESLVTSGGTDSIPRRFRQFGVGEGGPDGDISEGLFSCFWLW
ncbi:MULTISPECIES: hypothetical protein [unclassified Kitasatospora]|uniref:hypothetical protein n=1 Tax=unclassified Kitasatospora TaxID=2633591 RepID=UPI002475AA3E|nr:hypothetical protein [Kitasatospora sp. GAS204B]